MKGYLSHDTNYFINLHADPLCTRYRHRTVVKQNGNNVFTAVTTTGLDGHMYPEICLPQAASLQDHLYQSSIALNELMRCETGR